MTERSMPKMGGIHPLAAGWGSGFRVYIGFKRITTGLGVLWLLTLTGQPETQTPKGTSKGPFLGLLATKSGSIFRAHGTKNNDGLCFCVALGKRAVFQKGFRV